MLVLTTLVSASWLICEWPSTLEQEEKHKSLHQSYLKQDMLRLFQSQSLVYESTSFCFISTWMVDSCAANHPTGPLILSSHHTPVGPISHVLLSLFVYYRYNVWPVNKDKQKLFTVHIKWFRNRTRYIRGAETTHWFSHWSVSAHIGWVWCMSPCVHEHVFPPTTVSKRPPTVCSCPPSAEKEIRKRCKRIGEKVNKMAWETASITSACSTAHSYSLQCWENRASH